MQFVPKTEQEVSNIWPAGEYAFQIAAAEDTQSQKGNDMIRLSINIFNSEGRSKAIFDYLLEVMDYKLRHCAEACGLLGKYETGSLVGLDFEGKEGVLKLAIQPGNDQYPDDKNVIKDYVVKKAEKVKKKPVVAEDMEDEIPF